MKTFYLYTILTLLITTTGCLDTDGELQSSGSNLNSIDNLGDHTASDNINLNGNFLSGDGDTEGIFVDSDGKVGIGTNTPGNMLEMHSSVPKILIKDLNATINTNGHNQSIALLDSNDNQTGKIGFGTSQQNMFFQNGNSNGRLVFSADSTSGELSDGDLIVDSTGNVGIGIASPTQKLDVDGNIRSEILITSAGTATAGTGHLAMRTGGSNRIILGLDNLETGSDAGSNFSIWRYDDAGGFLATALHIERSSGNVSLGDSAANFPLDLASGAHVTAAGVWTNASDARKKETASKDFSKSLKKL